MRFWIGIQYPAKTSLHYGERLDFDVLSIFDRHFGTTGQ
jgi:hypothetical protein